MRRKAPTHQAHLRHQPENPLATDRVALVPKMTGHLPSTEEWPLGERLVDHPHQIQQALAEATRFKLGGTAPQSQSDEDLEIRYGNSSSRLRKLSVVMNRGFNGDYQFRI
jgi:hypothetical protein